MQKKCYLKILMFFVFIMIVGILSVYFGTNGLVKVYAKEEFELPIMPNLYSAKIITQPQAIKDSGGVIVVIKLEASNAEKYEWQYSSDNGKTWYGLGNWTGHDTNELSFVLNGYRMGLKYRCIVTGEDGKQVVSNAVGVVKHNKAIITKQPEYIKEPSGAAVVIRLEASNAESYEWQYSSDNGKTWYGLGNWTGHDTNELSFVLNGYRMGLKYRCIVTGNDGASVISYLVKII